MKNHDAWTFTGPAGLLTVDASLTQHGVRLSVFDARGRRHCGNLSVREALALGSALTDLGLSLSRREVQEVGS